MRSWTTCGACRPCSSGEWDSEDVRRRLRPGMPVGDAIGAVYESYAAAHGKPRWGDKTPMYMRHLTLLERLFPEARYVHLIRDGCDAALSFHQCRTESSRRRGHIRRLPPTSPASGGLKERRPRPWGVGWCRPLPEGALRRTLSRAQSCISRKSPSSRGSPTTPGCSATRVRSTSRASRTSRASSARPHQGSGTGAGISSGTTSRASRRLPASSAKPRLRSRDAGEANGGLESEARLLPCPDGCLQSGQLRAAPFASLALPTPAARRAARALPQQRYRCNH